MKNYAARIENKKMYFEIKTRNRVKSAEVKHRDYHILRLESRWRKNKYLTSFCFEKLRYTLVIYSNFDAKLGAETRERFWSIHIQTIHTNKSNSLTYSS